MVDSGIRVHSDLQSLFEQMKEIKKNPYDYLIMTIEKINPDDTSAKAPEHVALHTKSDQPAASEKYPDASDPQHAAIFDLIKADFKDKCCMALFYLNFDKKGQGEQQKLSALNWVPDEAPMKLKMKYSSTFKAMITKVPQLNCKFEVHSLEDLEHQELVGSIRK